MNITNILHKFGLLDHEEYLVPPEHPNVMKLIQRLVKYRAIVEDGKTLTPDQKTELIELEAAKDYYDEVLEEELELYEGEDDEVEDDEVEEEDDEEDDEEEEAEPVATLDEVIQDDDITDDEEDEEYVE